MMSMPHAVPGPLNGIVVLDLGQIYNGPYCTFLLARAGATVIKIEPPGGENMRRRGVVGGAMLPFAMLNSNKNFVTLDLKSEGGRELFLAMARKADVVVENFAPGVMDRLGIGPARLREENPRLIYAAGSGYGWSGPYRDYPAMDLTVQAMSGVMNTTGYPDGPPTKAGPALCDFFGGVHLYGAVATALFDRERTGEGRFVEVAMLESVYFSLSSSLGLYFGSEGLGPPRTGNRHGGLAEAPYNVYPAADGWLALICVTEAHWKALLEAMGRTDLADDPRFATLKDRVRHMDLVDEIVSGWTRKFAKEELFALLLRHRVPCAPVRDLGEVTEDPHLHARGALRRLNHPLLGDVILPTGAMRFGDDPPPLEPSKSLGADNEAVLRGWLGIDEAEYRAHQQAGVF
jgi:crotonobetainyl-CoA:carnitine CoA-transferase CaiB-like acyl-CoA transferase